MRIYHAIMIVSAIMALITNKFLYRNKSETIDDNVELSKSLTEFRRKMWDYTCVSISYGTVLIAFVGVFILKFPAFAMILLIIISLIMCCIALCIEMSTRHFQEKLTSECGKEWYVDEDDCWIGGMIYYNPNDSHLIVNNRIGTVTTVNLARKGGKSILCNYRDNLNWSFIVASCYGYG